MSTQERAKEWLSHFSEGTRTDGRSYWFQSKENQVICDALREWHADYTGLPNDLLYKVFVDTLEAMIDATEYNSPNIVQNAYYSELAEVYGEHSGVIEEALAECIDNGFEVLPTIWQNILMALDRLYFGCWKYLQRTLEEDNGGN
jgi:hypothetical protein